MPLPSGVRLRESCEACTGSKVKCSKHKPSCKRCIERGTVCQYMVTQKTGRRARRPELPKSEQAAPQPQSPPTTPPAQRLGSATVSEPYSIPFQEALEFNAKSAANLDEFMSSLPAIPNLAPYNTFDYPYFGDFNSPFEPPMEAPYLDELTQFHNDLFPPMEVDSTAFGRIDAMTPDRTMPTGMATPLTPGPSSGHSPVSGASSPRLIASTSIAIQLLERLTTGGVEVLPSVQALTPDAKELAVEMYMEQVIAKNQETMQTIATILHPVRAQDGYVLVLICLTLHKVISAYVGAFQYGEHHCLKSLGSSFEESPAALRRLVDELFHVRSLLTLVGKSVKLTTEQSDGLAMDGVRVSVEEAHLATSPITSSTLVNMHEELRKRLSELYMKSMEELKRFWV